MSLWNPLDPENIADPYRMYERLREESPVYKAQTGEWIVTGYNEVKYILTNRNFLSGNRLKWIKREKEYLQNKGIDLRHVTAAMDKFILQLDPPVHTRLRKFIQENWSDRDVEHLIAQNVDEVFKSINNSKFDFISSVTSKLPALNGASIMGIPKKDYQLLHELASHMIIALDLYVSLKELVRLNEASMEFMAYFKKLIEEQSMGQGVLRNLYEANQASSNPLTKNELTSLFIFVFVAGEETSVSFLGTALYNLLINNLYNNASNLNNSEKVVEELLRFDPPVQLLGRIANEDCMIDNIKIKKDDTMTLAIAAANRDPNFCHEPNNIKFNRPESRHLAFGQGIHYCLGDWLARKSATIALDKVFKTYPNIKLTNTNVTWNKNLAIRSLASLEVEV